MPQKAYKICKRVIVIFTILSVLFLITSTYMFLSEARQRKVAKITIDRISSNILNAKYDRSKVEQLYNRSRAALLTTPLTNEITVITAYFSLGNFKKGDKGYYTTDLYRKWMSTFKHIENPTIAYFDSVELCDYFKVLRQNLPGNRTQVILVNREDLWAFRIQKKIAEIFEQPGYPKFKPNTVMPEYSCAMHAKYELMKKSIMENTFGTKFFSWVDIGLFRHLGEGESPQFGISVPQNFRENSVAYGEVRPRRPELIPVDIVYGNLVWVCGCFFIGRTDTLLRWTIEYMEGVEWLLKAHLMNTDQQVIYIIANANLAKTPIQAYKNVNQYNNYFHLGYQARDSWLVNKFNHKSSQDNKRI